MARRRVNTKFLIVFSVILGVGVAGLFLLKSPLGRMFGSDQSKRLLEEADAAVKESENTTLPAQVRKEKLDSPVERYRRVAQSNDKNVGAYLKLGDAYHELTQFGQTQFVQQSRGAWDRILEIDPTNLDALRRLQESYYREVQINNSVGGFRNLRDRAVAIYRLDPKDQRAHALIHIATINQWLVQIATPTEELDKAVAELQQMVTDGTKDEDVVFFLAAAKVNKGDELRRAGQDVQAKELFRQAMVVFEDGMKGNDDNAKMHFRFYELLSWIRGKDQQVAKQGYTTLMEQHLNKALKGIDKKDREYVKMCIAAHSFYLSERRGPEAERILLDLQSDAELAS